MTSKNNSNQKQPSVGLPSAELRAGPKHMVSLPKKQRLPKPQKQGEKLQNARASKWDALLGELTPAEQQLLTVRGELPQSNSCWHMVEIPDGEFPVLSKYEEQESMVDRLKEIVEEGCSRVFVFYGEQVHISVGPLRHLLIPGQDPVPLFELPETMLVDETGYVGESHDEPESIKFESPLSHVRGDTDEGLEEIGREDAPGDEWNEEDGLDEETE